MSCSWTGRIYKLGWSRERDRAMGNYGAILWAMDRGKLLEGLRGTDSCLAS